MLLRIIDVGARIYPDKDSYLRYECLAKQAGVETAFLACEDPFAAVENELGNQELLRLQKRFGGHVNVFAAVNPWYGQKAQQMLIQCISEKFCGLYLNPYRQGFSFLDKIIEPLLDICNSFEFPIFCESGYYGMSTPLQIAHRARQFSKTFFIMGRLAWSDYCGYDLIPAAQQAENIFFETSCGIGQVVEQLARTIGVHRIVFGSGYPRSLPMLEVDKIKNLALSDSDKEKIFSYNARQLWKI